MPPPHYPLAAIVGQQPLLLALQLAAVDASVGGVLVEGPRGSAKSTAARGLADILDGRFVNLPLGATEEQVCGTLDLQSALGDGEVRFAPGLLARADGGVLYVDEVNLLPDHLVDILLDAAASGINYVERDGISHQHQARFVLAGTMNADEGELRPQLLDRFGLAVITTTPHDASERKEVVSRRLAFERDPSRFCKAWRTRQDALKKICREARARLGDVQMPANVASEIAARCIVACVEGLRADLILHKAVLAHAALRDASVATVDDLNAVAELVLSHRRKMPDSSADSTSDMRLASTSPHERAPAPHDRIRPLNHRATDRFDTRVDGNRDADHRRARGRPVPGDSDGHNENGKQHEHHAGDSGDADDGDDDTQGNHASALGDGANGGDGKQGEADILPARAVAIGALRDVGGLVQKILTRRRWRAAGEASIRNTKSRMGNEHLATARGGASTAAMHSATTNGLAPGTVDWSRTLATLRRRPRTPTELYWRARTECGGMLSFVVLDGSASTLRGRALGEAKGVLAALLRTAYQHRQRVGILVFGGARLQCVKPCGRVVRGAISDVLARIGSGGGTPLRRALMTARDRLHTEATRHPHEHQSLFLFTDGRSRDDVRGINFHVHCARTVIDMETSAVQLGRARDIAMHLGARYLHLQHLPRVT